MKTIANFFQSLHADDSGASFIEYTALLGVLLATAIGVLAAVGAWAGNVWTVLCDTLPKVDGTGCDADAVPAP